MVNKYGFENNLISEDASLYALEIQNYITEKGF